MKILWRAVFLYTSFHQIVFVTSFPAYWDGVMFGICTKPVIPDSVTAMSSSIVSFIDKKLSTCGKVVEYHTLLVMDQISFLFVPSEVWRVSTAADAVMLMTKQSSNLAASFCTAFVSRNNLNYLKNELIEKGSKWLKKWDFIWAVMRIGISVIYLESELSHFVDISAKRYVW